jgi:hypothetical protein
MTRSRLPASLVLIATLVFVSMATYDAATGDLWEIPKVAMALAIGGYTFRHLWRREGTKPG